MFTSHFLAVTISFFVLFVSSLFIFTFVCQKRDLPKTRWVDIHQGVTVISVILLKEIELIRFCRYHYVKLLLLCHIDSTTSVVSVPMLLLAYDRINN